MSSSTNLIRVERKFARQFVTAGVLIIVVFVNLSLYAASFIYQSEETVPLAYLIQLGFIPILLMFMGYYFFRLYRFRMQQLKASDSE